MKALQPALALASLIILLIPGCYAQPQKPESVSADQPKPASTNVREAAVAGLFYPQDKTALAQMIDQALATAPSSEPAGDLKALVCPHAGYRYSGEVAARAYKTLQGRTFDTVILLAPSHYARFTGASVSAAASYRTPLGLVPISPKARALAQAKPFVPEAPCEVLRPEWWRESSKAPPEPGQDTPHTWEHSAEVQVPFLQQALGKFNLVPVILGQVDPAPLAKALAPRLDDHTLLVASSDLSHYHPYAEARELDTRCVKAICDLDISEMQSQEACGKLPILTVMHLAREKGWKPRLLDCRNSGDTAGDKSRVVGYAAIAFYAPKIEAFTPAERKLLIDLARASLKESVTQGRLPAAATNRYSAKFIERKGCFVTLTKNGDLRGCIGHILPQESLYRAIMDNAQSAALRDPRFRPVQTDELDKIEIEISVLTEPQPLPFASPEDLLQKLRPHKDGVVLRIGPNGATYLPQVWEQLPDKIQFLDHLAEKAGCPAAAWRSPGAAVFTYQVESFKESELK
jgi:AmmeMemoRadiSam system protein B/AmmeMemoRadiSam system protein A